MSEIKQLAVDELLKALNELLEAERAGARVTLESLKDLSIPEYRPLISDIQQDEVRWCKMLMGIIRSYDSLPSSNTGNFYEKAMAIADLNERLVFINRGQAWVVKRLKALIPLVSDQNVVNKLTEMLEAHVLNINRVEELFN